MKLIGYCMSIIHQLEIYLVNVLNDIFCPEVRNTEISTVLLNYILIDQWKERKKEQVIIQIRDFISFLLLLF